MSYCRFSSMRSMCDIYLYEAVGGGFSLHVASMSPETPSPKMPLYHTGTGFNFDEIKQWHKEWEEWAENVNYIKIGGQYDGVSFSLEDVEDTVACLKKLRESGYNMPDNLEKTLLEEWI